MAGREARRPVAVASRQPGGPAAGGAGGEPPRAGAWNRAPRWGAGMTGRRALRGYRGRTETPPAKLSACAPWPLHPRITHAHYPPPRCAAWHRAHAESFACRGLPAGAPRPRHGARQGRAPGAMSLSRRHYPHAIARGGSPLPVAARHRAAIATLLAPLFTGKASKKTILYGR